MKVVRHTDADSFVLDGETYYPKMLKKKGISAVDLINALSPGAGVIHYVERGEHHGAVLLPPDKPEICETWEDHEWQEQPNGYFHCKKCPFVKSLGELALMGTPIPAISKTETTQETTMNPTVGRIVMYTNLGDKDGKYPPEQQAAIVTKVKQKEDCEIPHGPNCFDVWLHIFYATGDFFMEKVPFSLKYKRGHWTWPPREGESRDPFHTVTVNGVKHTTNATTMTYAEVIALAQHTGHPSVVWHMKNGRSGSLAPGAVLNDLEDLILSVAHTDNA